MIMSLSYSGNTRRLDLASSGHEVESIQPKPFGLENQIQSGAVYRHVGGALLVL